MQFETVQYIHTYIIKPLSCTPTNLLWWPWPFSWRSTTLSKHRLKKTAKFFKWGSEKMHFLLIKSQNFEKCYKIKLLKETIIYLILEYCGIWNLFEAARAFSVFQKSAGIPGNSRAILSCMSTKIDFFTFKNSNLKKFIKFKIKEHALIYKIHK